MSGLNLHLGKIQNNVTISKSATAAEAPSKEALDNFGIIQIVTLHRAQNEPCLIGCDYCLH